MQVSAISHTLSNAAAIPLFDSLRRTSSCHSAHANPHHRPFKIESPLIDAAFAAFENYAAIMNTQHQAMIAGVAAYALTPHGAAKALCAPDLAPFYALNLLA